LSGVNAKSEERETAMQKPFRIRITSGEYAGRFVGSRFGGGLVTNPEMTLDRFLACASCTTTSRVQGESIQQPASPTRRSKCSQNGQILCTQNSGLGGMRSLAKTSLSRTRSRQRTPLLVRDVGPYGSDNGHQSDQRFMGSPIRPEPANPELGIGPKAVEHQLCSEFDEIRVVSFIGSFQPAKRMLSISGGRPDVGHVVSGHVALLPSPAKARRLARFVANGSRRYSCDERQIWPEQSACRRPRRSNRSAR
jgi:hypothetical protein